MRGLAKLFALVAILVWVALVALNVANESDKSKAPKVACDPTVYADGTPAPCLPDSFVSITGDEGACTADYRDGAWHICDVVIPAPSEDTYRVKYWNGAWHLTYN